MAEYFGFPYDPEKEIPFIQFLRPHGRRKPCSIDRPPDVVEKARQLRAAGARFEIEELRDGTVSMTVERDNDETGETDVLAHELVPNGPGVPGAVDALVAEAVLRLTADTEPA